MTDKSRGVAGVIGEKAETLDMSVSASINN